MHSIAWSIGTDASAQGRAQLRAGAPGDGTSAFTWHEVFSGLPVGLIGRSLPDLNSAFAQFDASLKQRAERTN